MCVSLVAGQPSAAPMMQSRLGRGKDRPRAAKWMQAATVPSLLFSAIRRRLGAAAAVTSHVVGRRSNGGRRNRPAQITPAKASKGVGGADEGPRWATEATT